MRYTSASAGFEEMVSVALAGAGTCAGDAAAGGETTVVRGTSAAGSGRGAAGVDGGVAAARGSSAGASCVDSPRATTSTPALAEIATSAPTAANQGRRGRTAGDVVAAPAAALIVVCTGGCDGSAYGGRDGD